MKKTLSLLIVGILLGSSATFAASNIFPDVPSDTWFSSAVENLSDKGILSGYPDGSFAPTNNVNRAELAVILDRLIEYIETGTVTSQTACSELTEAKFKLAILNFWGVRHVFPDPENCNRFYYKTSDGSGETIWAYDLKKDPYYATTGDFTIPEGNTLLYNEKLAEFMEFRIAGLHENKIIFYETGVDNSPGPCAIPWLGGYNFNSIGKDSPSNSKNTFAVPDEIIQREEAEMEKCQESM